MIKVTTAQGKVFEGELFAIDPITLSLSIKSATGTYSIINASHITQISGAIAGAKVADVSRLGIKLDDIEKLESQALEKATKSLESVNLSVSGDIQALYDRISLLFPICRWRGNSIEVLGEYLIEAPYTTVVVVPGQDGAGLDRISKILERERSKLNL